MDGWTTCEVTVLFFFFFFFFVVVVVVIFLILHVLQSCQDDGNKII